jgi:hypothetical protein
MATKKQIAANRRNAQKATGPRTPRGKAVSRLNALRHGLRARIALPHEDLKELGQIRELFLRSYQPQTPEQARLVELMSSANWQLRYWQRAEDRLFGDGPGNDPLSRVRTLNRISQRAARYARAFMRAYQLYQRSTRAKTQPEHR